MHLHWERSSNTAGDCNIRSLSWMGRVPDEIPQEEGWKLNRHHYYQEGWLSTANLRGVVGVTYTTSHCGGEGHNEPPARTNYNLRGHRAEVTLVSWNEPYQKLASCDSSGIIFVWIKYEGRWSIELINDRNTPVICFAWSHDGRMALICYQDGFVLVGSVAGQRYWSTLLPPDVNSITSGSWTPDDQFVYLGTSQGGILVMDIQGNQIGRVTVRQGVPVTAIVWNCEKFNMEEQPESHTPMCTRNSAKPHVFATCFKNGEILLMRSYDDVIPIVIATGFHSFVVDWTNSGELLAVAGKVREIACRADHTIRYINALHFYNEQGQFVYRVKIPSEKSPVTAMTWGHNDKRLFLATGNQVHIGWVSPNIASLQLLCRLKIQSTLHQPSQAETLPLPCRLQNLISMLFTDTIKSYIPDPMLLRQFAIRPPSEDIRLHCTMIRHGESDGLGSVYTLYLEHLGGFLPLLKGKKVSKIRPEFVIFDPQLTEDSSFQWKHLPASQYLRRNGLFDFSEDTDTDDEVGSPRLRRRRRRRRGHTPSYFGYMGNEEVDYVNVLPETDRLAEVISNIWGTKFKIISLNFELLPPSLGQVTYKASLLHLQPRQMRLEIADLRHEDADSSGSGSEDDETDKSVTMKDDILTAVMDDAPIAPLPSRLSFYLPPASAPAHPTTDTDSNEANICATVEPSVDETSSTKRRLRVSVSCDNYLGDGRLTLGRRDSVGSPLSNRGSPRRWAAKPEELSANIMTSSVREEVTSPISSPVRTTRSCSANQLDAIVDILGVPSELIGHRDKRLFLLGDRRRQPNLERCGKSRSCDDDDHEAQSNAAKMLEASRRSVRNCRGRRKSSNNGLPRECKNCRNSMLVDKEANREIFDVPTPPNEEVVPPPEPEIHVEVVIDTPRVPRKFDSVRNLLERARSKLAAHFGSGSSRDELNLVEKLAIPDPSYAQSQSSPSTPLQMRRKKKNRDKSFSPVRSILNSPLLRRRRQKSSQWDPNESSDEEGLPNEEPSKPTRQLKPCNNGAYHNLETFQKKQLKQKMKKYTPVPSDPDRLFGTPPTPSATPYSSPFPPRRALRSAAAIRRRKLVLYNKSPMWNETSQVYQLDFGGRVTQESAKNFQVEYKGKQVMQFGRIDGNAYTLDFQYPFSACQAFAVALANVTQRLK